MADRERRPESDAVPPSANRKWYYPGRDEHPDEDIYIHAPWCKSCGICYSICPKSVLDADKAGRPVVARPEDCIVCHLCEMMCPDMAITVHKERVANPGGKGSAEGAEPLGSGEPSDEADEAASTAQSGETGDE
jgi:2-oxoglutarate ferredoxin oxidoreductase subunit delta